MHFAHDAPVLKSLWLGFLSFLQSRRYAQLKEIIPPNSGYCPCLSSYASMLPLVWPKIRSKELLITYHCLALDQIQVESRLMFTCSSNEKRCSFIPQLHPMHRAQPSGHLSAL